MPLIKEFGVDIMLKVKIINEENDNRNIEVNGIVDNNSYISSHDDKYFASIENEKIIDIFKNTKLKEIINHFIHLDFCLEKNDFPKTISSNDRFEFILEKNLNGDEYLIKFKTQYYTEFWSKPYSVIDFSNTIQKICRLTDGIDFSIEDETVLNGFSLISEISNPEIKLRKIFNETLNLVHKVFQEALHNFSKIDEPNILKVRFKVDDNIRNAYEQYLIYFSQFLKDIGIEVDSELKEEAQKILFSVSPRNSNTALYKIKQALELYLNLPYNKEFEDANIDNIAGLQLKENIRYLKSQLSLAQTPIQAKIKTINLLENMESNLIDVKKQRNEEEILNGLIKFKPFEKNGVILDVPKLIRMIKRFGRNQ